MHADQIREIVAKEGRKAGSGGVVTLEPVKERRGPWIQVRVPHGFEWNRYEVGIEGLRKDLDGFRIIHLTDLHFKPFWSEVYQELADRVTRANADLVLITGDFVDSKTRGIEAVPYVERFVAGLRGRLGVYGILGNHDGDLMRAYLARTQVVFVGNRRVEPAEGVELVGTTEVTRDDLDWEMMDSLGGKKEGGVRIVMSHYPDTIKRLGGIGADMVLAGHTHGGQVCLPGGRAIIRHDTLPRRMCQGVHRIGKMWLVVSRGLGFTSLPIRVWCPAEVVEIVLRSATTSSGAFPLPSP